MDKPLDVSQLSTCCGKPLVWTVREMLGTFDGACYECGRLGVLSERQATRQLLPPEKLLLGRLVELDATLANERGEGEPPVAGWRYDKNSGRWWVGDVVVGRPLPPAVGWRWGDRQGWDWQKAGTARDAMRAASAVSPGADAPKEG